MQTKLFTEQTIPNKIIKKKPKKTNGYNDIDIASWKDYGFIRTGSLWILDKRDSSGAHNASYWGNFVPEIPRQMMLRYTKRGDCVVDPFIGYGTTAIEAQRLGRDCIGIDLDPKASSEAAAAVNSEPNTYGSNTEIVNGDSRYIDIKSILEGYGRKHHHLTVVHPPYDDIIKFSDNPNDLSNAGSTQLFYEMLEEVVSNTSKSLEKGRFLILVIGDKYTNSEWISLGHDCMNIVKKCGYKLKSTIIKNMGETKGKQNQKSLWRYRALVGGFYIFEHEYIFVMQKI